MWRITRVLVGGACAVPGTLRNLWARLRLAAWAARGGEVAYTLALEPFGNFSVAYRKGTADELVLAHSFERDIFLAGVPEYIPDADDIVIDVGAHIGTFAMLVAPRVRRVYAVEASRETCDYLRLNRLINRLDNIEIFHLALGGATGTALLNHDRSNWGHSIMTRRSARGERVPMMSLADFMRRSGIERCDFLRMNCEGAEFPILLGAAINLLRSFEAMLVLYHCDLVSDHTPEELVRHLEAAGFNVTVRNRGINRGWIIATRAAAYDSREGGLHAAGADAVDSSERALRAPL